MAAVLTVLAVLVSVIAVVVSSLHVDECERDHRGAATPTPGDGEDDGVAEAKERQESLVMPLPLLPESQSPPFQ